MAGNELMKEKEITKVGKLCFTTPLSIPLLGSCGVPSCIIDLRLGFNTFLVAGLVRNIFLFFFIWGTFELKRQGQEWKRHEWTCWEIN